MNGRIVKRSVSIAGHPTSISLEEVFWSDLKALAGKRGMSTASLIAEIDSGRRTSNLSSALRLHVLAAAKSGAFSAASPPPQAPPAA